MCLVGNVQNVFENCFKVVDVAEMLTEKLQESISFIIIVISWHALIFSEFTTVWRYINSIIINIIIIIVVNMRWL